MRVAGSQPADDIPNPRRRRFRAAQGPNSIHGSYGHTPLSAAEDIPWNCWRLIVGAEAHGALPIMEDVRHKARARRVELVTVPTAQAIEELAKGANLRRTVRRLGASVIT